MVDYSYAEVKNSTLKVDHFTFKVDNSNSEVKNSTWKVERSTIKAQQSDRAERDNRAADTRGPFTLTGAFAVIQST